MAQSSPSSSACARIDDSFGPWAGDYCRGGFDFTLLFEESLLTLLPLGLVLIAIPPRVWFLLKRAKKVVQRSHWGSVKVLAWITLGAVQLVSLILWASPAAVRTRASLAAAALSLAATIGLCALSYAEHDRTVRPSSILNAYLLVTLLFDAARARTLWLRAADGINDAIAYVAVAAVAVKALVLALEATEKRASLKPEFAAYPPEAGAGIFSQSFFWWLNPLFRLGFARVLEIDDLFVLDKHLQATYLHARFGAAWKKSLAKTGSSSSSSSPAASSAASASASSSSPSGSLMTISFGLLKWPVLKTMPPRLCLTALNFCQPFLINRAVTLSQQPVNDGTTQVGYGLIGAYFLVYVGMAVATGQYQHRTYRTITMARGGLISLIYGKTASLGLKDVDPASSMTLMSADTERIVQGWQTMHEIWANCIEVGLAIYLLWWQLGIACVVPVGVTIASLLGSIVAMGSIMSSQAVWLEAIEKRISATSAMLASMKGVKMCGLKDTLLASLQKLRVEELRISKSFRKLLIWNMVFAYFTQVFAPVLTFAVFSTRARADGGTLDTARAFTALSLFALLSDPLASLVMSLATFLGATGSFTRIQEFLNSDERRDTRESDELADLLAAETLLKSSAADAIRVQGGDFGWDPEKPPQLHGINLSVPWRKLTMVVGPVGCGKSTLLHALLGEIPARAGGSVRLGTHSIAYCAQNPWHMNGTVRETILAGAPLDEKWYARVVHACALRRDFAELPMGDKSAIGTGGVALSGGQSQRLAVARAIYARREVLLLDDAFSGLDSSTENHVFQSLLGERGLLREMRCTVLLVSSSPKRLPYSDHIICLDAKGEIAAQGSFAELDAAGGYVSSFSLPRADWSHDAAAAAASGVSADGDSIDFDDSDHGGDMAALARTKVKNDYGLSVSSSETICTREREAVQPDASRQTGDMQIYLYYVKSVGWVASIVFVVAIIGFIFCISFPNIWVQWWAAANEIDPNAKLGYWLGIYAMFGGVAIVSLFISCWQMIITMVPRSGEKFHFALLNTVLSAPMSFFVNTDTGVTMNRFSQDLQLIDMELPIAALNTFATFVLCIAQMVFIGVGSIYAAISFPIVLLVLFLIQKVYLRTSRQLRLMDLEAKAPLYSLFEESLSGLATIRAFGWQASLQDKNYMLLDRSQRPFYLLYAVQRWLTLLLDLLVAAIAVILIVLVVELRGTMAAGGVGLALLNVIQFGQSIKMLVTFWTTLETHIGSVARVRSFAETAVSEDLPGEKETPPLNWPASGAVEFQNLSATYNGRDLVLKDVSLSIQAGEKVGICGRTGSGKTSLIMSLFRTVDMQEGTIRVDGVDIATLPRQEVRSRIVGVAQHAFLLKGSVRLNADPTGTAASDDAIRAALQAVQFMHVVDENGGLDADVDALNLSAGQKQLFCLARAMLRPSTILVLDEATSSIDTKTEETMQRLIRRKFANHTIIAVAHRLETIMDFDKVAVFDAGRLIEFDNPYALLDVPDSAFARLYNSAIEEEEEEEELGGGGKEEVESSD